MQDLHTNIFDTNLSDNAKTYLLQTVRWTKFLAIMGFIFTGIILTGSVLLIANGDDLFQEYNREIRPYGLLGISIFCLIGFIFYWYPTMMLYKFSSNVKLGIAHNDALKIEQGFRCQKNMYKFIGITLIIILSLYTAIIGIDIAASLS